MRVFYPASNSITSPCFIFSAQARGRAHGSAPASMGSAPRSRKSLTSSIRPHRHAHPSGVLSSTVSRRSRCAPASTTIVASVIATHHVESFRSHVSRRRPLESSRSRAWEARTISAIGGRPPPRFAGWVALRRTTFEPLSRRGLPAAARSSAIETGRWARLREQLVSAAPRRSMQRLQRNLRAQPPLA